MKPYYDEAGITIYCGDCREVMPTLFGRFDLLLTDPPYGLGIAANPVRQRHERKGWDNQPAERCDIEHAKALCEYQIIWGGNYFDLSPHQCFLVWDKVQPEGLTLSMCELAWTNLERPAKLFRRHVVSYLKEHPTEKPEELMAWCIAQVATAERILDPWMGSGTTLAVAKRQRLRAIGIEIEERYCEIAAKRLSQSVLDFGPVNKSDEWMAKLGAQDQIKEEILRGLDEACD